MYFFTFSFSYYFWYCWEIGGGIFKLFNVMDGWHVVVVRRLMKILAHSFLLGSFVTCKLFCRNGWCKFVLSSFDLQSCSRLQLLHDQLLYIIYRCIINYLFIAFEFCFLVYPLINVWERCVGMWYLWGPIYRDWLFWSYVLFLYYISLWSSIIPQVLGTSTI